jgi:hypothetical protein
VYGNIVVQMWKTFCGHYHQYCCESKKKQHTQMCGYRNFNPAVNAQIIHRR